MNREDCINLSKVRLKEAKLLYRKGHYDGAAYLVGYVFEMALKARICKILNQEYPLSNNFSRVYKTHEFDQLLILGGLRKKYDDKAALDVDFQQNYSDINGWSEDWRYKIGTTKADADKLFNALEDTDHGVLTWLKKLW